MRRLGLRSPSGKPLWNPSTIRGILTNPAYIGQVYAGRTRERPARLRRSALHFRNQPASSDVKMERREWVPVATIPAVVSPEQFELVQVRLEKNQQFARRHNTTYPYLLRALVSCGVCQLACGGRARQPGYAYYVCRGKGHPIQSGRIQKCPARFIPAQQLDALVWADLCQVVTHPELITDALRRAQSGHWLPQELQARREQLRKGGHAIVQQLERLTAAYLNGVIPLGEYERRRQELEQRQQTLDNQHRQLAAQVEQHAEIAGVMTSIQAFCQRVQRGLANATFVQQRELVELLIDRIVVTNEEVEIRYVIPTASSSEQVRFCHLRTAYFNPGP